MIYPFIVFSGPHFHRPEKHFFGISIFSDKAFPCFKSFLISYVDTISDPKNLELNNPSMIDSTEIYIADRHSEYHQIGQFFPSSSIISVG